MLKKVKRRYLALTIGSTAEISTGELMEAIWGALTKLYGEYGASKTNLNLISFDEKSKFAVLRTGHTSLEMVRTALASITRKGDKHLAVHVLAVSGTIKALYRRLPQEPFQESV